MYVFVNMLSNFAWENMYAYIYVNMTFLYDDDDDDGVYLYKLQTKVLKNVYLCFHTDQPERYKYVILYITYWLQPSIFNLFSLL
jgi:hypothetical protein